MKTLVIYDSLYGNTEQIARAIGGALGEDSKVVKATEIKAADIAPYSLIFIGSPTQGGRHTPAVRTFLDNVTPEMLKDKRVAAFDTRAKSFFVKLFGWASSRIEADIKGKGGNVTAQPQGFFVKATKGPLVDGELERAASWAKNVAAGVPTSQMPGNFEVKTKE